MVIASASHYSLPTGTQRERERERERRNGIHIGSFGNQRLTLPSPSPKQPAIRSLRPSPRESTRGFTNETAEMVLRPGDEAETRDSEARFRGKSC